MPAGVNDGWDDDEVVALGDPMDEVVRDKVDNHQKTHRVEIHDCYEEWVVVGAAVAELLDKVAMAAAAAWVAYSMGKLQWRYY